VTKNRQHTQHDPARSFECHRLVSSVEDIISRMSGLRETFDAGRKTVRESLAQGQSYDPAGQGNDQSQLRGMGKRRFVLIRGIFGFSIPMFLFLALSDLSKDIHSARAFHQPMLRYLLGQWIAGFCVSMFLGFVVGLLAWRRIVSDVWPGAKPDVESSTITLGPLSR
jgi:hypothetical protein